MARILLIETSASTLSVAVAQDGVVLTERICREPRRQASLTAPLVKETLDAASLRLPDCDAVAVSSGPGSYTGLRVGVSTAKGLCFGASLPLIAVGTPDILVAGAKCAVSAGHDGDSNRPSFIVPMIDARRMEVYTAVYNSEGERITPVEAKIVEAGAYDEYLCAGKVLFVGDGAMKCREVLSHPNAMFMASEPLASNMASLAEAAFRASRFEDVAYFEPFYLKDFVATVSRKNLL